MTDQAATIALYALAIALAVFGTGLVIVLLDGLLEDFRSMLGDDHNGDDK